MIRKMMAGEDLLRASGTVTKKLAKWLAARGYVAPDEAGEAVERGADAARDLPRAEKLATLLYAFTSDRYDPRDSDIEGMFQITRVEPGRVWLEAHDDRRVLAPPARGGGEAVPGRLEHLRSGAQERQEVAVGRSLETLSIAVPAISLASPETGYWMTSPVQRSRCAQKGQSGQVGP